MVSASFRLFIICALSFDSTRKMILDCRASEKIGSGVKSMINKRTI